MGIQTKAELTTVADVAKKDFDSIKSSGLATADGLATAFKKYAEAAIAANGGVAPEILKSEAAMYGLQIQADSTGQAIIKAMGDGQISTENFTGSVDAATEALKAQAAAADTAAAAVAAAEEKKQSGQSTSDSNAKNIGSMDLVPNDFKNEAEAKVWYDAQMKRQRENNRGLVGDMGAKLYNSWLDGEYRATLAGIKESQDRAKARDSTDAYGQPVANAAASPAKTYTVNINLGGQQTTINTASDADAQALIALLQRAKLSA